MCETLKVLDMCKTLKVLLVWPATFATLLRTRHRATR